MHKIFPFTIRLKEKKICTKSFEIKFDVGATVRGVAFVDAIKYFFFAEITHRGKAIKKAEVFDEKVLNLYLNYSKK